MYSRFAARAAIGLVLGCGAGTSQVPIDGGNSDAAGQPDGGADGNAGTPIEATSDTWTWVDFPESRCLHGGSTGIAVNPHAGSTHLVLFVQGGGWCTDCWGATADAKVGTPTAYTATELATEADIGNGGNGAGMLPLQRGNGQNPFRDASFAFVPYCTGDLHAGTMTRTEDGHDTFFWGARDLDMFLKRLVPTFASVERVTLVGTSAGGFGAVLDYAKVAAAFRRRVDLVVDSAPPIDGGDVSMMLLWGVVPPENCTTCADLGGVHHHNRSIATADARFAYLSNQYDEVIAKGLLGANQLDAFHAKLEARFVELDAEPQTRTFVVLNPASAPSHVVFNKPKLHASTGPWLAAMTHDDPTWSKVRHQP